MTQDVKPFFQRVEDNDFIIERDQNLQQKWNDRRADYAYAKEVRNELELSGVETLTNKKSKKQKEDLKSFRKNRDLDIDNIHTRNYQWVNNREAKLYDEMNKKIEDIEKKCSHQPHTNKQINEKKVHGSFQDRVDFDKERRKWNHRENRERVYSTCTFKPKTNDNSSVIIQKRHEMLKKLDDLTQFESKYKYENTDTGFLTNLETEEVETIGYTIQKKHKRRHYTNAKDRHTSLNKSFNEGFGSESRNYQNHTHTSRNKSQKRIAERIKPESDGSFLFDIQTNLLNDAKYSNDFVEPKIGSERKGKITADFKQVSGRKIGCYYTSNDPRNFQKSVTKKRDNSEIKKRNSKYADVKYSDKMEKRINFNKGLKTKLTGGNEQSTLTPKSCQKVDSNIDSQKKKTEGTPISDSKFTPKCSQSKVYSKSFLNPELSKTPSEFNKDVSANFDNDFTYTPISEFVKKTELACIEESAELDNKVKAFLVKKGEEHGKAEILPLKGNTSPMTITPQRDIKNKGANFGSGSQSNQLHKTSYNTNPYSEELVDSFYPSESQKPYSAYVVLAKGDNHQDAHSKFVNTNPIVYKQSYDPYHESTEFIRNSQIQDSMEYTHISTNGLTQKQKPVENHGTIIDSNRGDMTRKKPNLDTYVRRREDGKYMVPVGYMDNQPQYGMSMGPNIRDGQNGFNLIKNNPDSIGAPQEIINFVNNITK